MTHPLNIIETELNAAAWHLKVAAENGESPCPVIIGRHLRAAQKAQEELDNFYAIKKAD